LECTLQAPSPSSIFPLLGKCLAGAMKTWTACGVDIAGEREREIV
jgi:hypothetical protein